MALSCKSPVCHGVPEGVPRVWFVTSRGLGAKSSSEVLDDHIKHTNHVPIPKEVGSACDLGLLFPSSHAYGAYEAKPYFNTPPTNMEVHNPLRQAFCRLADRGCGKDMSSGVPVVNGLWCIVYWMYPRDLYKLLLPFVSITSSSILMTWLLPVAFSWEALISGLNTLSSNASPGFFLL